MPITNTLYFTLFILYGVIIGSFLNVCIYRIPRKISTAKGRSFCPSCSHTLQALDLVPVVSWIFLRGRCRYCKAPIPFRYTGIELLTGLLFGAAFFAFPNFYAIPLSLFICVLVVVSFIDIDTGEIPDRMHIFIVILAVANIIASRVIHDYPVVLPYSSYIIGFFAISVPMLAIAYFTGGFGGGDIKLMAAAGLFLGWQCAMLAFFIGAILGAVYGIYLMLFHKAKGKSTFSFGPHLCIGIIISCFFGQSMIQWYLTFAGF